MQDAKDAGLNVQDVYSDQEEPAQEIEKGTSQSTSGGWTEVIGAIADMILVAFR